MLPDWLISFGYWHWFIISIVLIIFEILLPTTLLVWIGIGAFSVGISLFFMPDLSAEIQIVLFAIFSVLSIIAGRFFLKHRPIVTDQPLLNRRGEQYVGRIITLEKAVLNGVGTLSIDDIRWRIVGPDINVGSKVIITGVNGTSLVVSAHNQ